MFDLYNVIIVFQTHPFGQPTCAKISSFKSAPGSFIPHRIHIAFAKEPDKDKILRRINKSRKKKVRFCNE